MSFLKKWRLALGMVLCGVIGVTANSNPGKSFSALEDQMETQDVRSLDRRISLLEQRLYAIEASINRLQQSALSERPSISHEQPARR